MQSSASLRHYASACCSSPRSSGERCRCRRTNSSVICRAAWPNLLSFSYIWYQPLAREIHDTWDRMPSNILGIPVFALLIWLHAPLWKYFANLIRSLSVEFHQRIVIAAIVTVSAAYLIMFAIVFDYSRWISNWAVCMFLILHAVKTLPASQAVPLISTDDRNTTILGWIVTLVPRVGIVRPF